MPFIQFGGEYRQKPPLRASGVVGALGIGVAAVYLFGHGRSLVRHRAGRREAERFINGGGWDDDTVVLRAPGESMTAIMARPLRSR